MKKYPKVTLLGAGSFFFGRQAIWQMIYSEHLKGGTLALVDTDGKNLTRMVDLAKTIIKHEKSPLKLEVSNNARDVLKGSDFVVLSFAERSAFFRDIDCRISEKYGIRMCSGDTIGPGGIFRTLREFPKVMAYCEDIRKICPDAWVINYINPTAAHGKGLRMFAPDLKSFALCDGLHMPHVKIRYAKRAGIISDEKEWSEELDKKFDFRIDGPNHFTWVVKADYEGNDMTPVIAEALRKDAAKETDGGDKGAKAKFNERITYELYRIFGSVPACTGHTKEYVRFWQGLGKTPEPIPPLSLWDVQWRYRYHDEMWKQVEGFISGETPASEYKTKLGPDHATDIIETMWNDLKKPFYINTVNNGAVPNMPDDAFMELLCDIDMNGPKPRPGVNAPVGLRGLWQQVLDTHELTARAAVEHDRALLKRAMMCDPMVSSPADADALIEELLKAEREVLPKEWF